MDLVTSADREKKKREGEVTSLLGIGSVVESSTHAKGTR